jgi:hypothetical protein
MTASNIVRRFSGTKLDKTDYESYKLKPWQFVGN